MIIMNKILGHTNQVCLKKIEKLTNIVIKWINIYIGNGALCGGISIMNIIFRSN